MVAKLEFQLEFFLHPKLKKRLFISFIILQQNLIAL